MNTWLRSALVLGLTAAAMPGCGKERRDSGDSPEAAPRAVKRVALLTVHPPEDQGLNQSAKGALDRLAAAEGLEARHTQVAPGESKEVMWQAARDGFDLIVLLGEDYVRAAAEAVEGRGLRNSRAVCVGSGEVAVGVETVRLRLDQASYLCGVLAGLTSQTHYAAAIGDERIGLQADCLNAFVNGAHAVSQAFVAPVSYAYERSEAVIRQSTGMAISKGADMVFQTTSVPGAVFGAVGAMPNVFAFGSYCDQSRLAPRAVIASAVIDMDAVFNQILDRARRDVEPRLVEHSLSDGVIRLAINPALGDRIRPETLARIQQAEQAIKAGTLDVRVWPGRPTSQPF